MLLWWLSVDSDSEEMREAHTEESSYKIISFWQTGGDVCPLTLCGKLLQVLQCDLLVPRAVGQTVIDHRVLRGHKPTEKSRATEQTFVLSSSVEFSSCWTALSLENVLVDINTTKPKIFQSKWKHKEIKIKPFTLPAERKSRRFFICLVYLLLTQKDQLNKTLHWW